MTIWPRFLAVLFASLAVFFFVPAVVVTNSLASALVGVALAWLAREFWRDARP